MFYRLKSRWLRKKIAGGRRVFLLPAGVFFLLLLSSGCRKAPAKEILFRYQFHPGETFVYEVSLRGEGEVEMTMAGGEGEEERISLPVRLEGSYLMEIQVESVFPEGGAELALRYRDFDLTTVSTVRDREMTVLLSDRGLMISEGDRVLKKTEPGEDGFPLRGVIGEKFEFRVDNRGTIIDARVPPAPDSLFSALDFTSFLERMQPEFPREPVPAGASWSRTIEVPGPGLGRPWDRGERWSVQFDSTFRDLTGSGGQVARIDFAGDFRQAPPAPEAEDRSGMRGSSHNLSGTYEFDRAAGRVLASRSILRQVLDSRIDLDQVLRGRKIDIRVNDTLEVAVRLRQ